MTLDLFPKLRKRRGTPLEDRGSCVATDVAVQHWLDRNGLESKPTVTNVDDTVKTDSSRIELSLWTGGERNTAVALYKVIGGGHGLPGKPNMLPRVTGQTNQDINGLAEIWKFFQTHHRDAQQAPQEIGK